LPDLSATGLGANGTQPGEVRVPVQPFNLRTKQPKEEQADRPQVLKLVTGSPPCLHPLHLQHVFTFDSSQYVCGQEYYIFAWTVNAYGQSEAFVFSGLDPIPVADCYS
jgi:hypothetical protein